MNENTRKVKKRDLEELDRLTEVEDISILKENMDIQKEEFELHKQELEMHKHEMEMNKHEIEMEMTDDVFEVPEIEFEVPEIEFNGTNDFNVSPFMNGSKKMKTISIRGVNALTYDQFVNKIKTLNLNIGDAMTKIMKDVISSTDKDFPELTAKSLRMMSMGSIIIRRHKKLVVTKQDLLDTGRKVQFVGCTMLKFSPDIDKEIFLQYVNRITRCKGVFIPKTIPKLLILSRIQNCSEVKFYKGE